MTVHDPIYITTTIPYVNAKPHVGFALELVQADVLARHYRRRGHPVRYQTGTDDNSLKNVLAAEAQGLRVRDLVDRNAAAFSDLAGHLSLSADDEIRTSSDERHKPGVHRLWRACQESGDIYLKHYAGLYCVGCEQFYQPADLVAGQCPEHGTEPELISEENWFFRLSAYADRLRSAITTGRLRIEPAGRRNEVLSFIDGGLNDLSISRSATRARGWGIPVPDDPSQVIYVWFDALGNYITALGYGGDDTELGRWWSSASRQIHLLGKGVLRFHAVYWPAILLRSGRARRYIRNRRPALVAAPRCTAGRRRRFHREQADRQGERRAGQRDRQPGEPGRRPDRQVPRWRGRPSGPNTAGRHAAQAGAGVAGAFCRARQGGRADRRRAGWRRLPQSHSRGLGDSRPCQQVRQPYQAVGSGQGRARR